MPNWDVVVAGSINVDLISRVARHPLPGETLIGTSVERSPGGKGANQAVAAALRGARTAMVGAVGTDGDAAVALSALTASGVDLANVRRRETSTGLAVITVSDDGENTIVVIPGANGTVDAQAMDQAADLTDCAVLVIQAEIPMPANVSAVCIAAASGARVIVNAAPATAFPLEVLRRADPLVVNEHEVELVLAAIGGAVAAGDPHANARALVNAGVPSVVVTLGPDGALIDQGATQVDVPSPAVRAVDTTGAGDAFVGAMAAALAHGSSLTDAATQACRVAAYAVQYPGAQPSYPDLEKELP